MVIDDISITATKTRPVDIPETITRLITKCVVEKVRHEYVEACGVKQLCTGVRAGLEAGVQAIRTIYTEGKEANENDETEVILNINGNTCTRCIQPPVAHNNAPSQPYQVSQFKSIHV